MRGFDSGTGPFFSSKPSIFGRLRRETAHTKDTAKERRSCVWGMLPAALTLDDFIERFQVNFSYITAEVCGEMQPPRVQSRSCQFLTPLPFLKGRVSIEGASNTRESDATSRRFAVHRRSPWRGKRS
jgi:hypothetical protein